MSLKKLGAVSNTQHHAHPLVLCDSKAKYGGWSEHEAEIIGGGGSVDLDGLKACIADGGQHGHVDVFLRDDGGLILVNAEQGADAEPLAVGPFEDAADLGTVEVPSGTLSIGIAYHALNWPSTPPNLNEKDELLSVAVKSRSFGIRAGEIEGGWRIDVQPL